MSREPLDRTEMIIVGGGISGLSLAFYCARNGIQTLVLESDAQAGGALRSLRTGDGTGEYWIEMGAHTCYNSYGNLLEIIEGCGLLGEMRRRERVPFRVLVNDQVRSIFTQINYAELLISIPVMALKRRQGETVESFYSAVLGRNNYRNLFRHFFNAVPSQETDEFPADLLFKSRPKRKDILRSYTFAGGLQTLADGLARFAGIEVVTGQQVAAIDRSGDGFVVSTAAGEQHEARAVAIATPAPAAARLLKKLQPELAEKLAQIATATVHSTGVIVRREQVRFAPLAGIVSPNDLFYSVVSRDTVPDEHYRGFTFHFKPEVADEARRLTRICEVLGVERQALQQVAVKENILPALKVGHEGVHDALNGLLTDPRLLLTGNYFGGVAIEDCVSRSLAEFNRLRL